MYITQGLKRAALVNHQGIATIDGGRKHTWEEFERRVAKLAGALQTLGLRPDGRVAILSFNNDRYLEYFFAVPWAGGIIVPLIAPQHFSTLWVLAERYANGELFANLFK